MMLTNRASQSMLRLTLCLLCLPGGIAQAQNPPSPPVLEVVDFRNVSLHEAMRLLSLQTDLNIVPSAGAGKEKVNLYLTNVKPENIFKALETSNQFIIEEEKTLGVINIYLSEERKSTEARRIEAKRQPEDLLSVEAKQRILEQEAKRRLLELEAQKRLLDEQLRQKEETRVVGAMKGIVVKGRVVDQNRPAVVVLEIDGKLRTVAERTTFTNGEGLMFRLEQVSETEVRIMALTNNKVFILN